jgi:hypothetical protein
MTTTSRRIALIAAAATLGTFSLGCGIVQNAVDTANTMGEFTDRLGKSSSLTYTAEYQVDGGTVTLFQQPPNFAVVHEDGRLIMTPDAMTVCDAGECQQAPTANNVPDELLGSVAGGAFVTPELALSLVAAAAIVPGSDVSTSEKEFAGQDALCADVTGIEDPTNTEEEIVQEFSVCVTDNGILASFSGATNTGEQASISLVSYSEEVDDSAFAPPADATVVDVTEIS